MANGRRRGCVNPNGEQSPKLHIAPRSLSRRHRAAYEGNTMPKFMPSTQYEPEPVELSPNREALKSLNAARAEAAAEVDALRNRVASLAKLKESSVALEAELSALDADEAAALAEWSATPDTSLPEPDVAARADVMARLSATRQRIASADAATMSVEHALGNANAKAARLESEVPALIASVLVDEARALLPGIVEAAAAMARAQGRYESLRKFLLERAEAAKDVAMRNGFFADLERLDKEAADAAGIGPLISYNVGAEWRELARELGDTPIRPAPAPIAVFNLPETKWTND
jgi:hypothetical protein